MSTTVGGKVRFARALRSRPFALLWVGQTISTLGNGAFYTAIAWQVLLLTGSATAMGAVLVAQSIPRLIFMLMGGVLADRLSRRLVMLVSDASRALAVGAIAVLGALNLLQLWHLVALALCFGLAEAFFLPAYQSIPPQLVEVEALPSANALTAAGRQLSQLAGPALGAAFIAWMGPSAAFGFDGATFVFSALCLLFVRVPPKVRSETGERRPSMLQDIRAGLGYVLRSPWLWVTIVIASLANVGTAPFVVALPKLVKDVYGADVWLLGAALAVTSAGALLVTLVIGQLHHLRRRGLLAYGGTILAALALAAFGVPPVLDSLGLAVPRESAVIVVLVGAACFGIGLSVFGIIWDTVLQELIPVEMLGRVSSIDYLGSFALTPIGLGLVGVLADRVGAAWVFVGGGALNLALNLLALTVKGIRELD
jgi:DHA3 family tetracycline resistance protein-like MFS transporter